MPKFTRIAIIVLVILVFAALFYTASDKVTPIATGIVGGISGLFALLFAPERKPKGFAYYAVFIISFFVLQGITKFSILPNVYKWDHRRQALNAMHEVKYFQLLTKDKPEAVNEFMTSYDLAVDRGVDWIDALKVSSAEVTKKHFSEYMARSSDETLVKFFRAEIPVLRRLETENPEACWKMVTGQDAGFDWSTFLVGQDTSGLVDAMALIIESSITSPQPAPDPVIGDEILSSVRGEILETHGPEEVVFGPDLFNSNVDKKKACFSVRLLLEHTLDLPEHKAGLLMRYMSSLPPS